MQKLSTSREIIDHPRLRILWPKSGYGSDILGDKFTITHWIFISDPRSRPITYGHEYVAFHKDGHTVRGYQIYKEFD